MTEKELSLKTIATTLITFSQQYLDGEVDEKTYRVIVGGMGFAASKISPRQAQLMLDAAKMDVTLKKLEKLL